MQTDSAYTVELQALVVLCQLIVRPRQRPSFDGADCMRLLCNMLPPFFQLVHRYTNPTTNDHNNIQFFTQKIATVSYRR